MSELACPFTYSDGRQCCGHVERWRVYGWRSGSPLRFAKKVRLWCTDKGDHAGTVSSWAGKEKMEFYPDKLPAQIYKAIEAAGA